ncbi:MAG: DNA-binding response OmpR family regulator [Glaciecola sp.]|jgi:DNA-binding response OmpR family regulator|uniref:response regulator transcription factor n=1 Tax=Congregibacter sp. TaxID=2744308 RepID=UPI0039E43C0C
MSALSILLVEDHLPIAGQVTDFLQGHGWQVDHARTGQQALTLAATNPYHLVLLDLNLPDMDGVEVCEHIKQSAEINMPILMLTARDSFEDKAMGFGHGADDYLTKPFDLRELVLRCQALAKRNDLHHNKLLELGDLRIDTTQKAAWREEQILTLTSIGFKILVLLAQAYPNPLSRSALLHQIWGDALPDSDALKSHIYSLRNELDKPFASPMLKTITNVGYKLDV